ncbi:competence/damage-inducible protein A, partial [Acidobacteriota bacterium]
MHSNPVIEILAVGSEMLTPFFQDTNSLFLIERLNDIGLTVDFKTITGDEWDTLTTAIRDAVKRSDIVIAMGGLGPTKDDQTREAFASVLGAKLIFKDDLFKKIESRFNRRKLEMPLVNKKQAYIFEGSTILNNRNGTAPGLWLEQSGKTIILLPGPPHEIKPMFDEVIIPRFAQTASRHSARRIIRIAGMAESKIESQIFDLYPEDKDLHMTTLAKPGQIELRLSSYSMKSESEAESRVESLCRS